MGIELASTVLGGRRGRLAGGSVSPAQAAFSSSLPASGRTTGKGPAFGPPWGHQSKIQGFPGFLAQFHDGAGDLGKPQNGPQ